MTKPRKTKPRAKADDRPAISILAALATKVTTLQQQVQELAAARSRDDDPQTDPAPVTPLDGAEPRLLTDEVERVLTTCLNPAELRWTLRAALKVLDAIPRWTRYLDSGSPDIREALAQLAKGERAFAENLAKIYGVERVVEKTKVVHCGHPAGEPCDHDDLDSDDCCSRGDCR